MTIIHLLKIMNIIFVVLYFTLPAIIYSQEIVKDIDGNVYHTVKIGEQIWMAENLKVTHYRNGDKMPNIKADTLWRAFISGAYCNYDNSEKNVKEYGRLYNWYAVMDKRGIAPEGWHVPSDLEVTMLVNYLSLHGYAYKNKKGAVAKSLAVKQGWKNIKYEGRVGNDQEGNNSSGFSGLPAGHRYYDGKFMFLGNSGFWWTTSYWRGMNNNISYFCVTYHKNELVRDGVGKIIGFSIRCVKDKKK